MTVHEGAYNGPEYAGMEVLGKLTVDETNPK